MSQKEKRKANNKESLIEFSGLIIEDEVENIEAYKLLFTAIECNITIVTNLSDALCQIKSNIFNFIILDGNFPESDGKSATQNYTHIVNLYKEKMKQQYMRPLILHISSNKSHHSEIAKELILGGIDCFMDKNDFNPSEIINLIKLFGNSKITYGSRSCDIINTKSAPLENEPPKKESSLKLPELSPVKLKSTTTPIGHSPDSRFFMSPWFGNYLSKRYPDKFQNTISKDLGT